MRWLWLALCIVAALLLTVVGLRIVLYADEPGSYLFGLLLAVIGLALLVGAVDEVR